MRKIHIVKLKRKEKSTLENIIKAGTNKVSVIRRAQILLKSDAGYTDNEISEHTQAGLTAIKATRKRYCKNGIERAIYDAARSGRTPKFTQSQDAQVIALACTTAPEGHSTWTLELICEKAKDKKIVKSVSRKKVWTLLRENNLKPWQKKTLRSKVG